MTRFRDMFLEQRAQTESGKLSARTATAAALSQIETAFGEGADEGFRREVAESTPLKRWGTPADVAAAALYLASPAAAFITGQAINVNGGTVM